jgi:hypothetical protein
MVQLALDAQYEAVLWAAIKELSYNNGSGKVYLTLVGDGAFENQNEWVECAIARAYAKLKDRAARWLVANNMTLNVYVCHHGTQVDTEVVTRIDRLITQKLHDYW